MTGRGPEEVALDVRGLSKSYGSTRALSDLSLTVGPSEVVGLLGPNGAGKTTAISCISGLLRPDAGEVRICGVDALRDGRRARQRLSLATQHRAVYPSLTVESNLRFYAALADLDRASIERQLAWVVDALELQPILHNRVHQLSTGQQRLAHVASAFVQDASLVVLDEPTAGLDVSARSSVLAAVRHVAARGGAVLYSSHYLAEVEELCSRVTILHRGEVIAADDVGTLVARHGGGHVEFEVDGQVVVEPGVDVARALSKVDLTALQGVRVVRPSLEAVFLALTSTRMDERGEVAK